MRSNFKPSYKKSLSKLRNILSRVIRNVGTAPQINFEDELRRAVKHIQIIKNTAPHDKYGDLAMVEAYKVYVRLQRLHAYPQYFSDNTPYKPQRVEPLRSEAYNRARPASVRWDVAAMMAVPMGGTDRNWWRPPPRPMPVKHFTREELELEYPNFPVSKKRNDAT